MRIRIIRLLLSCAAPLAVAGNASAVDGVVLIDQNRVFAGAVTPGDTPGFPVTISQRGSYRLSSNLTVPDANTDAIVVSASDVTIDLNGFSILGPVICSGGDFNQPPLSCTGTGSGRGIAGGSHLTVTNGTVRGMGSHGVLASENCRIDKVHAISNGANGMSTLNGCVLTDNVAMRNGTNGIFNQRGTLIGNTAVSNGEAGITCTNSCQISKSSVSFNGGPGIAAGGGSVIANSSATFNGGSGIASIGGTVVGNTALSNTLSGIFSQSGLVKDNLSSNNTGVGLQITIDTGYAGNVFVGNNGGNANPQVSAGSALNLGHNKCGNALCP